MPTWNLPTRCQSFADDAVLLDIATVRVGDGDMQNILCEVDGGGGRIRFGIFPGVGGAARCSVAAGDERRA